MIPHTAIGHCHDAIPSAPQRSVARTSRRCLRSRFLPRWADFRAHLADVIKGAEPGPIGSPGRSHHSQRTDDVYRPRTGVAVALGTYVNGESRISAAVMTPLRCPDKRWPGRYQSRLTRDRNADNHLSVYTRQTSALITATALRQRYLADMITDHDTRLIYGFDLFLLFMILNPSIPINSMYHSIPNNVQNTINV